MVRYLAAIVLALLTQVANAQPDPSAKSVLVIDADTKDVLFQKNQDDVRPIASITKLVNAIVILNEQQPMDEKITITEDDVAATMLRGYPTGTSLPVGTTLTRAELLHLALMNSQNRAAAALARSYPGGVPAFVLQMNATAKLLGMTHSKFVDPTGLINTNVSTVGDLALLVSAAANYPVIRDFSTSTSFQMTQYSKRRSHTIGYGTTNRLVKLAGWDTIVQKTGFINDAGHCMVMMTKIASRRVVMVLLNTPSNDRRTTDAITLKYWVETGEMPPATQPKSQRRHR